MEMTYDGRLVMPTSFATMDEEEMIYVEGGRRISGSAGWAMATALFVFGGEIEGIGNTSVLLSLLACTSGGVLGCIAGSLMGLTMYGVSRIGNKFRKAGQSALAKMAKRGYFYFNVNRKWSTFLQVS